MVYRKFSGGGAMLERMAAQAFLYRRQVDRAPACDTGQAIGRLVHLDGLRGIAAIGVVLYHVHNLFGLTLGFERGYLFVDLFFMLSGFVLDLAWARDFGREASARDLIEARVRRLWPTIAAGAILGAAVHWRLGDLRHFWLLVSLALLLLPYLGQNGTIYPLNGPQWSIFWELFANVVHILWLRRLSARGLMVVAIVMGLGLIAVIAACGENTAGPNGDVWWMAVARVGWAYSVGMLVARRIRRGDVRSILRWWQALALIVLTVLALPFVPLSVARGDSVVVVLAFPLLFWLMVTARPPDGASRGLAALGAISFPLYATHVACLVFFASIDVPKGRGAVLAVGLSLVLSACPGVASAWRKRVRRRAIGVGELTKSPA